MSSVPKISFDSNAWEAIFEHEEQPSNAIRAALEKRIVEGYICAASFQIEAIKKSDRSNYFSQPYFGVIGEGIVERDGQRFLSFSMGPENGAHHGIPNPQHVKLERALSAGIKLMRGQNWMGLPLPKELSAPQLYVFEDNPTTSKREQLQLDVFALLDGRNLGHAAFLDAGGWEALSRSPRECKKLARACAEWSDGELVAAHIAYRNTILCTEDRAIAAGRSVFDAEHRAWLSGEFGVRFMTISELSKHLTTLPTMSQEPQ